jgi:hypothetical protein
MQQRSADRLPPAVPAPPGCHRSIRPPSQQCILRRADATALSAVPLTAILTHPHRLLRLAMDQTRVRLPKAEEEKQRRHIRVASADNGEGLAGWPFLRFAGVGRQEAGTLLRARNQYNKLVLHHGFYLLGTKFLRPTPNCFHHKPKPNPSVNLLGLYQREPIKPISRNQPIKPG